MSHQNFNNQISNINSNRGLTDLLLSPVKEMTTGFPSQWVEALSKQAHLSSIFKKEWILQWTQKFTNYSLHCFTKTQGGQDRVEKTS